MEVRVRTSKNENKLKIVNECKITREKWTRRIVNKREVKEYQIVFDTRIVLDNGQESILYGYNWNPSTNSTINPIVIPPAPDNLLYTLIRPFSAVWEKTTEIGLMEYDDTNMTTRIDRKTAGFSKSVMVWQEVGTVA